MVLYHGGGVIIRWLTCSQEVSDDAIRVLVIGSECVYARSVGSIEGDHSDVGGHCHGPVGKVICIVDGEDHFQGIQHT